jgi:uncharacterized membrane protein HdeD (DUF308 family)
MKRRMSRTLFLLGFALVAAAAVRAVTVLIQAGPFDPWALVLVLGCLSLTIGMGLLGNRPKGN